MSKALYDGDTFAIDAAPGHTFQIHLENCDTPDAPWERAEGHGPVRTVNGFHGVSDKRPGERVLYSSRGNHWVYDWQAACKMARKDGWDTHPLGAPNRIERAVKADFDYLKGWLSNDWCYVGVCVTLLDKDGEEITDKYSNALWGIESNSNDYIREVAEELALECAKCESITTEQRSKAWRAALHETRERRYWESRGIATI